MAKKIKSTILDYLPDTWLDKFTKAYIEAALWSTSDGGEPMNVNYGVEDIAPKMLAKMKQDCDEFQAAYGERIVACKMSRSSCSNLEMAGHDFWLTRNHHGAGFWDGDWPRDLGQILTEASHRYGDVELYAGDDGKIYAMGCE